MSYILVVVAGVSWGLIGLFTKVIAGIGLSELDALAIKATITAIFFLIFTLIKDKSAFKLKKPSDVVYFIGTGLFSFAFFSLCYMKAINMTSAGVAVVLLYTAPAIIMVYSTFFLKEPFTRKKGVVLLMTLVGCALVAEVWKSDSNITIEGLIVGLLAGFGYALYSIFGSMAVKRGYSPETITVYTFSFATIGLLLLVSPMELVQEVSAKGAWALLIVFALLTTVLPFFCYTKGLVNLPPSVASVIATIEPVVGAILGILVLKESAGFGKLLGIVLIIGGVFLLNMKRKNNNEI